MNLTNSYGSASQNGMGIGISSDTVVRAKMVAGFAQVARKEFRELDIADIGQVLDPGCNNSDGTQDRTDLSGDRDIAGIGLPFPF